MNLKIVRGLLQTSETAAHTLKFEISVLFELQMNHQTRWIIQTYKINTTIIEKAASFWRNRLNYFANNAMHRGDIVSSSITMALEFSVTLWLRELKCSYKYPVPVIETSDILNNDTTKKIKYTWWSYLVKSTRTSKGHCNHA